MESFLKSVERRAFVVARMQTKDQEEALDIVQDAMFTLVQKYSDRPLAELGPLFHTILYSKINDWHRKQKVRNRWRVFFGFKDFDIAPEDTVPQEQFLEPEAYLEEEEINKHVLEEIKKLPPRQQEALVLRAWEGFSVAETAEIMKCSQGSVKTHYSRAVHMLRNRLGEIRKQS
jgi:RNA polymerase sigma-70 factor (ECF subfamily)